MISVNLLGGAALQGGEGVIAGPATQRHRVALLAMLAVSQPRPLSRDKLIAMLWPDSDEEHGRGLLKQSVHMLRRALGEGAILSAASALWLNADAVACDVVAFESALASGEFERAVKIYSGPLLDGFHLPGSSEFEHWLDGERDRLQRAYLKALEDLAESAMTRDDPAGAVEWWRRVIAEEPYNARVTMRLMESLDAAGDRAGAIQQARLHANLLNQEFGAEPDAQVSALSERLRTAVPESSHHNVSAPVPRTSSPRDERTPAYGDALAPRATKYPLIGRNAELDSLRAAWHATADGQSRFALILGEAGIGKTRIAEELLDWAGRQGIATARSRSYAAEGTLAYAPVKEWLCSPALRPGLEQLDPPWLTEVARLMPELTGQHSVVSVPELSVEKAYRQRLFTGLAHAMLRRAEPLILLLDDLQWCDSDTLQWLHYLLRFLSGTRLLVAGTARTEEVQPGHALIALVESLRRYDQLIEIALTPLNAEHTAILAAQVAGHQLGPETAARLYSESEGNPLFVVESVRAGSLDSTHDAGRDARVRRGRSFVTAPAPMPSVVQAVIQTRLAQLSPAAQKLAGVAATIGRDFTLEVLSRACGNVDASLMDSLDELWQRRIIREHGTGRFDFSHDRLREVTYAGIGPVRRRALHGRAAEALLAVHASNLDAVSGRIAAHYDKAGQPALAIPFYQRAAKVATAIFANDEAVSLIYRALGLLAALPEDEQRDGQELALRIALRAPLRASKGWAAPELGENTARAHFLCDRVGTAMERLGTLWEQLSFQVVQGRDLQPARQTAREALTLALAQQDESLFTPAHHWMGVSYVHSGDFVKAREHFEQAAALYDRRYHSSYILLSGVDYGVLCRSFLAHTLWHLGYPDQAVIESRQNLALAKELEHPFSYAVALAYDAMLFQFRDEPDAALQQATATVAISIEHGFPYYHAWGTILHGWATAEKGNTKRGIASMRDGIAAMHDTGANLRRSYYLALLAEKLAATEHFEEARALVGDALKLSDASGEHLKDADLHRIRGELLLRCGDETESEAAFRHALTIAQRQHAKSHELRAAISLGRLLQRRKRCEEARQIVGPVLDGFTEGFDTPALIQAKLLLSELT